MHEDIRGLLSTPRKLTYRQVCVWLRHLPNESALARRGLAGETEYSLTERLYAGIVNELRKLDYHFISANSDPKKGKITPPEMIDLS